MNNIMEVADAFYAWLPVEVATPNESNNLYIPAQLILVLGRDKYISEFIKFFDKEVEGKFDMDKTESLEAIKRQAFIIDQLLKKGQVRYPHPSTRRKSK